MTIGCSFTNHRPVSHINMLLIIRSTVEHHIMVPSSGRTSYCGHWSIVFWKTNFGVNSLGITIKGSYMPAYGFQMSHQDFGLIWSMPRTTSLHWARAWFTVLVTTSLDITSEFTSPDITFKTTPRRLEVVRLGLLMSSGPASHVDRNRAQLRSHAQELPRHAHQRRTYQVYHPPGNQR